MLQTSEQFANKELMENYESVAQRRDRQTDENVKQPEQHRRILARSQQTQRGMIHETIGENSGPTACEKSRPAAGERADLQLVRKSMQSDLDSMMVDSQRTRTSSCVTKVART